MSRFAYVDGRYLPHQHAHIHIEDRGFQFADSIYEVIACINGHLVDEKGHLDRLERSLNEMDMAMPLRLSALRVVIRELLRKNRSKNAAIYIQISRGSAKRDFIYTDDMKPSVVITARRFAFQTPDADKTLSVVTLPDLRWARRDIKTTALYAQSMTKTSAIRAGYDDAWMVDADGYITEGTANNAWIVKGKSLITRGVSSDILKGVTRNAVLGLAEDYKVEERAFTPEEAYEADEAFTTSATALIMPVSEIDEHQIGDGGVGALTRHLQHAYYEYMNKMYGQQFSWNQNDE